MAQKIAQNQKFRQRSRCCWLLLPLITAISSFISDPSLAQNIKPAQDASTDRSLAKLTRTSSTHPEPEIAQAPTIDPPQPPSQEPPPVITPQPLPEPPLEEEQLPPPEELIPQPELPLPGEIPATIRVEGFNIVGSTVFSPEELAEVTAPYVGRDLTFAELLQVRSAVTQLYVDQGYVTSGAFLPPQTIQDGMITIEIVEGSLEEINITGTQRLNPGYVRSRLELVADTPLNVNRLLEGLQLLQLDPLIETISADLQAGVRPGTSILQVEVTEADTFAVSPELDNGRSPSVGSFRRTIGISQANLLGFGDGLSVSYANTDGSNEVDASYIIPINPRNGTIRLSFGLSSSDVIEPPFDDLDIAADSRYYELAYRQPIFQSPTEEFALGIIASRQESETELLGEPFPLSFGANEEGETRVSVIRIFQEWIRRSSQEVLAARSQFSIGLDLLDATVNDGLPDSRFVSWRGQGQWVRLLAPDTLFLVRTDIQLTGDSLVPLEQFGVGGQLSVRGYRQDFLLADNGVLFSTEVRLPVLRVSEVDGLLQVVPFLDIGTAWTARGDELDPSTLVGLGVGLLWQQSDTLSARIDWGIPLIDVDSRERTWQESGIYFSILYTPF
ncbi:MAG: ShlB/FhaC/HecB family hemolysin secretion/activation protein [Cyanobacteria bacterium CRU_2_1]|nr:ShlB/FhaC/HecB family hemolysin secretion/activation protein [Cyanobacteria bacterium RU_5_0]NJR58841.1 ShlB/FhaC/HecB family hemolysin secretion/activation protein [Cyanobacteria bacterium CRU_2_1]